MSRTENSLRNIRYALVGQIVGVVVNFIARTVFVRTLTAEYLGLNGLFFSIISMLSLAELGIGTAITFSMYEPLSQKDTQRVRALMGVYRKAYLIIGCIVGGLGSLLTPFLPMIINEMPSIPNIEIIYLLFVASSAIGYLFSYKSALLFADQRAYITTAYAYGFFVVRNTLQILILVLTRNYILFLAAQVALTLLENITVSRRVDRMYPYLRAKPVPSIEPADRDTIIRNVKALLFHRLGGAFIASTTSVVMAKFVGVVAVGLYSNYLLITNALTVVLRSVFTSLTASIGNLGVEASRDRQVETFRVLDFGVFWAYSFASISLFVLFNPFIEVWLGAEYLFDWPVVLAIAVNFYLTGVCNSVETFKNAKGLFWPDRYRPLAQVAVNLALCIILADRVGVLGIFIGTALSTILVRLPVEPYVLYKHGFNMSVVGYYRRYLLHVVITVVAGTSTWVVADRLPIEGLGGLVIKLMLCFAIPNTIICVFCARSSEFRRLLSVAKARLL